MFVNKSKDHLFYILAHQREEKKRRRRRRSRRRKVPPTNVLIFNVFILKLLVT
jgi:hypothetical protein